MQSPQLPSNQQHEEHKLELTLDITNAADVFREGFLNFKVTLSHADCVLHVNVLLSIYPTPLIFSCRSATIHSPFCVSPSVSPSVRPERFFGTGRG